MSPATRISAVRTTGIFCRPGCPARPLPKNVEHFDTVGEALVAGYRPCKRCHPLHEDGKGPTPSQWNTAPAVTIAVMDTPLGAMIAAATSHELVMLEFADRRMLATQFYRLERMLGCRFECAETPVLTSTRKQLNEFFAGSRDRFDLPLSIEGTPFQKLVWNELLRIPPGATRSYAEQARAIGRPEAVRAVARANGDNRIAIIVPCHRVIGSDGSLTGYGGGLWRKKKLLERELSNSSALQLSN